jgi:glycosyltransferase involved in cell wall biosynthesis
VVKRLAFAVPGDLDTPTGGYAYDKRMIAELTRLGWDVILIDLGNEYPRRSDTACKTALATLSAVPEDTPIVIDGLAFGVLPEVAAVLARTHRLVALVHHPLARESGLTSEEASALRESERAALAQAHHVITTTRTLVQTLIADYSVPPAKLSTSPPGTDKAAPANGSGDAGPISLLAVGAVVPRKGYDVLIAALATRTHLPWRLTIVGDRTRDSATAQRLEEDIARLGLSERVTLTGAVPDERLDSLYDGADLFVLASRYEGYGMGFAAAIARGLPVIGTNAGAIPETVPADAGILVPPDNVPALAAALHRLITDAGERRRLAAAARAAAAKLPTWAESAVLFSRACEKAR